MQTRRRAPRVAVLWVVSPFGILLGIIIATMVVMLVVGRRVGPSHPLRVGLVRIWWLAVFFVGLGLAGQFLVRSPEVGFAVGGVATAYFVFDWFRTRNDGSHRWWDP